ANSIDFTSAKRKCFDLYYDDMEQCVATKNDLIIEFKEKDQPFEHESLSEIRFHVPIGEMDNFLSKSQNDDSDATFLSASQLSERIRNRADLTFSPKNAVVKFANQQLITPRGRYEVGLSRDTLFLHGKTFSYKSKLRDFYKMFLLPNDDGHYLAVNLKKPLNFGKTFYHFVIIKFGEDSQITVSVDIPQKEIEEKYDGKLSREMEGPSFRITTRIFKTLSNTKVFMPGSFENTTEQKYIRCAMKTSAGFLYPMEASFVFCPKPVVYVQHSKIESVSFLRLLNSMSSTKMFDLALTLKKDHKNARKDAKIVFTGIDKREFPNLFKFLASKNLRILDKEIYEKRLNLSDAGQRSCRISGATNVILPNGNSDTSSDEDFDETKTLDQLDRKLRETTENIENEEISSSSEIDVDDI
ncbi:FACT complex subunit ssrp1, partial [Bonamia ostreae]